MEIIDYHDNEKSFSEWINHINEFLLFLITEKLNIQNDKNSENL
jgi:hypothetical protein